MAHPLDGSRAKIERAGDHLEELDAVLSRFVKDGGFRIVGEPDGDTGEYVFRCYSNRQPYVPPPRRASLLIGDALHNLRSALDYLIWQLAEAPSKKNQFPICDTPRLFEEQRERHLSTVPKRHWAKIESYQPYKGIDRLGLAMLAKLNDVDKHHLLLPGAIKYAARHGKFTVSGLDRIRVTSTDWVPYEEGAVIYRMRLEPDASGQVNVKADIPYTITFGDPDSDLAVNDSDLRKILISISNVVESFASDF
jgi:hypothetical protein